MLLDNCMINYSFSWLDDDEDAMNSFAQFHRSINHYVRRTITRLFLDAFDHNQEEEKMQAR